MIFDEKYAAEGEAAVARRIEVEQLRRELAVALCQGGGVEAAQRAAAWPSPLPEVVADYLNRVATRLAVLLVGQDQLLADDDAAAEHGAHTD